jgi:hypothetical protein
MKTWIAGPDWRPARVQWLPVALCLTLLAACDKSLTGPAAVPPAMSVSVGSPLIGGFDRPRGGFYAYSDGTATGEARAAINAVFPNAAFVGSPVLTDAWLGTLDAVVISSVRSDVESISPLSPEEQDALRRYVDDGGCAVLFIDNAGDAGAAAAYQSLGAPFGITSTFTLGGLWTATVADPDASPITNGPFGRITSHTVYYPLGLGDLGAAIPRSRTDATVLPVVLAEILPGALAPGSGRVVIFGDVNLFNDGLRMQENKTLLQNVIASCGVRNQAPTALIAPVTSALEGMTVIFSGAGSTDPDGDPLTFAWDFDNDGITDATTATVSRSFIDNGAIVVRLTVSDGISESFVTTTLTVANVAPTVTGLRLPAAPVPVGTLVTVGVDFVDPGISDRHSADIDWQTTTTTVGITNPARSFNASQTFLSAGVYTVLATVSDNDNASGARSSSLDLPSYIVVYDPAAGFVTGGGWIISSSGSCRTSVCTSTTSGKATFGFVSKYKRGETVPTGNAEFHFTAGDLRFSSTSYEWLVVADSKAKFKGEGTINGAGQYGFMITAIDAKTAIEPDRFRIKIWNLTSGGVIYDNKMGSSEESDDATEISGGSIVVHKQ